jgi:hypothetical protein
MKDVVSDETVLTKLNSYFLTFDLFSINFKSLVNGQVLKDD